MPAHALEDIHSPQTLFQSLQREHSKQRVNWLKGGLGALRILPLLAGMLTGVQSLPITNGTWLYTLIITKENLERADSYPKYLGLFGVFYSANMIL